MAFLGVRCSNSDFTYAILTGEPDCPKIIDKKNILFPKNYLKHQSLKWFLQEIEDILKNNITLKVISIKGTEPLAQKGKSFISRTEYEAIIYLAAANNGIKHIFKKVKSTIAKDLGLKGKVKYLSTKLDYSVFPNFESENDKMQEAILVAWSSMK